MKALLDTHAFLWWVTDDARLSSRARAIIADGDNELFLSAASGWEMAIKTRLGKLHLPDNPASFVFEQLRMNAIEPLAVQMMHALRVYSLPGHHRDPFDRILVAQAQVERMLIITADPQVAQYDVEILW
ncbi:MAG: type II toxin-antitoxin system VapC family toxin [Candidatus Bipolaricaulota bacterium]|nr:type II toxin-antitoxin system VapC family toxin [Candidatus Bipolaricaulota bacterium]